MSAPDTAERAWTAVVDSYFRMLSARRDLLATDYHSDIEEALTETKSADTALRLLEFLPSEHAYQHIAQILMAALRGEPYHSLAVRVLHPLDSPTLAGLVLAAVDESLDRQRDGRQVEILRSLLAMAGQQEAAHALGRWYEEDPRASLSVLSRAEGTVQVKNRSRRSLSDGMTARPRNLLAVGQVVLRQVTNSPDRVA